MKPLGCCSVRHRILVCPTYGHLTAPTKIQSTTLVWQLFVSSHKCCTVDIGRSTAVYDTWRCSLGTRVSWSVWVCFRPWSDNRQAFGFHRAYCQNCSRANLIHRCFLSKNRDLLFKAYITYVRPILEYNSPLWSPSLKKDILLESVQRRFTKKIPGLATMTYYSRLKKTKSREFGAEKAESRLDTGVQNSVRRYSY